MTKGGLKDGEWVEIDHLPAARLSAKWRYLLCKHLRQACPHDSELRKAIDQRYRDHRGYQVHTDSFYPKGLKAAKYIGHYLGQPPLATSHIPNYDGQTVTYWYKDTYAGQRITVTCSAPDFISRLVPHIPPKGMQVVRYAGLYARNVKRKIAASGSKPPSATIRSNVPTVGVLCNWPKSGNPNAVTHMNEALDRHPPHAQGRETGVRKNTGRASGRYSNAPHINS